MNRCPQCGVTTDGAFCPQCGARTVAQPAPQPVPRPAPAPQTVINVQQRPIRSKEDLPEKFRPLGAWAYFGLGLLYTIPVVGFIFLIIHTFNGSNINRRSFARSHWCWAIIEIVIVVIALIVVALTVGLDSLASYLSAVFSRY